MRRKAAVVREIVQKVRQGFSMHEAMFQRHMQKVFRRVGQQPAKAFPDPCNVVADVGKSWPIILFIVGELLGGRIDSRGEQAIELDAHGPLPESISSNEVPIEGFKMT